MSIVRISIVNMVFAVQAQWNANSMRGESSQEVMFF